MSVICQNVGLLTTTVVKTVVTVFVSSVLSQGIGTPSSTYVVLPSSSCSAFLSASVSTSSCVTSYATHLTVLPPPPGPQVQVPTTVTSQYLQTQFNTIVGSSCTTVTPRQSDSPPPTTAPGPGITDTTYTTEYVTVTGSDPSATTTRSTSTPRPTGTSSTMSRHTVYHSTDDPASDIPSDTAIGAVASPTSSSSDVPVGAIAGGVVGGVVLIVLLGVLAYFLLKKPVFAPKGYERPAGDEINEQYTAQSYPQSQDQYTGSGSAQSGSYPLMQDQGGYGYSQQYQGSTGDSMQYSDHAPPQGQPQGLNPYTDSPGTQPWQNMAAVAALVPVGAAAGAVIAHSPQPSNASSVSPTSYTSSSALLLGGSRHHQQQSSQGPFVVPYRGYAEPGEG